MKRIAITGGIGSGKTTLCQLIEQEGVPVFYCDNEARRIMQTDTTLQQKITSIAGGCDRTTLRNYITQGPEHAARINQLVWPRVASAWQDFCHTHEEDDIVIMECALLFESGFCDLADESALIVTPLPIRLSRIQMRDGISEERARGIIALQFSDEEKNQRATHTLLNDSTPNSLLLKFKALHPTLWKQE